MTPDRRLSDRSTDRRRPVPATSSYPEYDRIMAKRAAWAARLQDIPELEKRALDGDR